MAQLTIEIPDALLPELEQVRSPQDILSFKVSEVAQGRLKTLLDRNREGGLSEDESLELDGYEQLDQLMQMLKIRAYSVVHQTVEV
jgi:hypothetical protein